MGILLNSAIRPRFVFLFQIDSIGVACIRHRSRLKLYKLRRFDGVVCFSPSASFGLQLHLHNRNARAPMNNSVKQENISIQNVGRRK